MRFFISDLHFGHKNIIKYCSRPWDSVEAMDEGLIENWNSTVGVEDEVIVIGDFALGPAAVEAYSQRLNGRKTLVSGNHDPRREVFLRNGWHAVHPTMCITVPGLGLLQVKHIPYKTESLLLCGHVHDQWKRRSNTLNLSVEQWGYKPVTEAQILEALT